jgi:hypothetical protein
MMVSCEVSSGWSIVSAVAAVAAANNAAMSAADALGVLNRDQTAAVAEVIASY